MNRLVKISALCVLVSVGTIGCGARDTTHYFSIDEALRSPQAQEVLDPGIKVQFARGGGRVVRAGLISNKKTNSLNKSDEEACLWAFLSAVKQFQKSARDAGANKVVNLISFYKRVPYKSATQYECHAGTAISGVALKGDLAR